MTDSTIRSREYLSQILDFRNLKFASASPTDIDALLDLRGQAWVLIEAKHRDKLMMRGKTWPRGQAMAIERLITDLLTVRPAIAIRALHETPLNQDVDLGNAAVFGVLDTPSSYRGGKWRIKPYMGRTVREVIEEHIEKWEIDLG